MTEYADRLPNAPTINGIAPYRYKECVGSGENVFIEIYPQNSWSHINSITLNHDEWNDDNDFDYVEDRIDDKNIIEEEGSDWLGIKSIE